MTESKSKRIKPDEKLQLRKHLYFWRSNCSLRKETASIGQRYLLELTTLADPTKSLADVFHYFSHSIFEVGPEVRQLDIKNVQFNRLFRFMVEMYHLHEKYLPDWFKKTEETSQSVKDIIGKGYIGNVENAVKLKIENLYQTSKQRINQQIRSIQKEQSVQNEYSDFAKVRMAKTRWIEKYQKEILSIIDPKLRAIYIPNKQELQAIAPQYIRRLLTTLMNVQFTRSHYRHFKMKYFLECYKDLWKIDFHPDDKEGRRLTIKRYTSVKNVSGSSKTEMLMNLNDLVDLRKKEVSYVEEYLEVIKELGKELRSHKKTTLHHYPLLHPKYVVFNQLSLKVSLSYQAPLLATLGLLKLPASLEQAIAFAATPLLFDQYSAPIEHLRSSGEDKVGTGDQIFYDLLYGMDHLVQIYDPRSKNKEIEKRIKGKEKLFMTEVKMEREMASEAWRFVMVASYLLNGREYYKQKVEPLFDYERFKRFLFDERRKCDQKGPKEYVEDVMGTIFTSYLSRSKIELQDTQELSLTIFDNFFGVKQEISEISVDSCFYKVNLLIVRKRKLKKDIVDVLQNNKQMNKMISATRCFIILYFLLFEVVARIQMVSQFYGQSFARGKELVRFVGGKMNISEFAQNEEEDNSLEKAYNKLKAYEAKYETRSSDQIKHLFKYYDATYKAIDTHRNAFFQLRTKFKQTVFSEQSEESKEAIQEIMGESAAMMGNFQSIIIDIMEREFLGSAEELAGEERRKVQFVNSIHVKMRLFLFLNHDNYTTLDSLVVPILVKEKEGGQPGDLIPLLQYAREILREYEGEGRSETGGVPPPKQPT